MKFVQVIFKVLIKWMLENFDGFWISCLHLGLSLWDKHNCLSWVPIAINLIFVIKHIIVTFDFLFRENFLLVNIRSIDITRAVWSRSFSVTVDLIMAFTMAMRPKILLFALVHFVGKGLAVLVTCKSTDSSNLRLLVLFKQNDNKTTRYFYLTRRSKSSCIPRNPKHEFTNPLTEFVTSL